MLKFAAWPPESGSVSWTPSSLGRLAEIGQRLDADSNLAYQIGVGAGSIIAANVAYNTAVHIDLIGRELCDQLPNDTQADEALREMVEMGFQYGANLEVESRIKGVE